MVNCPNHPDIELDFSGSADYIMGEKKKETHGVGFCSKCGFHVGFNIKN